ncbi:DNase I-like protein [Violaceomyces palustris]|uniref:DNase I-like protein n=1 Tax=Violaceomyces palustris TaxID=1673888 RepID=A0ACD0NP57_9BASI|nr:DNase I-like protein [Violaceomyces palustris]
MRILVWNVNGLRTLKGYQPWYKLPDWQTCLEHLGADFACFQEIKMTRKQLEEPMCIMSDYHSFFNFHPNKGYSGTATYVRKELCVPLKAEQGITGRLVKDPTADKRLSIGCRPVDCQEIMNPKLFHSIDDEGRAVVLDCGMFVLFNLYCPNETGPERLEYKMSFYHCLAERAHRLIEAGRQVVIVGDMNICREAIDHCDAEQSIKDHELKDFKDHPARAWFDGFLAPKGKLFDVGRMYHPDRKAMYTCWNTLIDARPANYGTRLDYTLVTEGLLKWVKGADIQPEIYGSDHCPVYIDFHDSLEIQGQVVHIRELLNGGREKQPPPLASINYDEFSGKQRKLASFFGRKQPAHPPPSSSSHLTNEETIPGAVVVTRDAKRENGGLIDVLPSSSSCSGAGTVEVDEPPSLAEALSALRKSQEDQASSQTQVESQEGGIAQGFVSPDPNKQEGGTKSTPSCSTCLPVLSHEPGSSYTRQQSSGASLVNLAERRAGRKDPPSSSSVSSIKGKKASTGKSTKGVSGSIASQTKLGAFFSRAQRTGSTTKSMEEEGRRPAKLEEDSRDRHDASVSPDLGGRQDHRSETRENEWKAQDEVDRSKVDAATVERESSPLEGESLSIPRYDDPQGERDRDPATGRVTSSLAWGKIFKRRPPPKCRGHGEDCKSLTVNKTGLNQGRKFWICSRPVGPGYEKKGRKSGPADSRYRCDFFVWDSDVRSSSNAGLGGGVKLEVGGSKRSHNEVEEEEMEILRNLSKMEEREETMGLFIEEVENGEAEERDRTRASSNQPHKRVKVS